MNFLRTILYCYTRPSKATDCHNWQYIPTVPSMTSTNPYMQGQAAGQPPAAPTILSYGQFHQSPTGAYVQQPQPAGQFATYQTTPYATAVTSYGSWHYAGYGYVHPQSHAYGARPSTSTSTSEATATPIASQRFTFPAYRQPAATAPTTGRGSRKQSHFKGLFAKERELTASYYMPRQTVQPSSQSKA
jgi:hypothetical protein